MSSCRRLIVFVFPFLIFASLQAASKHPAPLGYVTDLAGILDESGRHRIENELSQFQAKTSNEIAVMTVPSLNGDTVENFANGVFTQWGVGEKGKNNGVLILIAPAEHKVRIEVGYGLEPILTDGFCGDIIRTLMVPYFKNADYAGGIESALLAIRQQLGDQPVTGTAPSKNRFHLSGALMAVLFGAFYILPFTLIALILLFLFVVPHFPGLWGFAALVMLPLGLIGDGLRWKSRGILGSGMYYGGWGGGGFGGFGGGGGFGGFGGGMSGGGGASGGW
jgi:uncharacterized protein